MTRVCEIMGDSMRAPGEHRRKTPGPLSTAVQRIVKVQRFVKAASHSCCSAAQQGEALECALNQVHCRGLLEDCGLAAPEASRLAADIIGNVRSKTLERVQSSTAGPLTKVGKHNGFPNAFAISASPR
ncbi:hypothetical protein T492DRAFT_853838 [Pavlovales sp. CCMP2436]|nr:hypothetical protein T492DRAFT_853838 [Pavlovales sp. CCMP2436]